MRKAVLYLKDILAALDSIGQSLGKGPVKSQAHHPVPPPQVRQGQPQSLKHCLLSRLQLLHGHHQMKVGRVDLVTFETFQRSLTSPRYRDIALNIQEFLADVQEEGR